MWRCLCTIVRISFSLWCQNRSALLISFTLCGVFWASMTFSLVSFEYVVWFFSVQLLDSFFVVSFEYVRLICVVLWVYQTRFVVLVFVFVRLFAGQRHQSYSFGTTKIKNISDREINERVKFTFTQYFRVQKLYVFYLHLRGKKPLIFMWS